MVGGMRMNYERLRIRNLKPSETISSFDYAIPFYLKNGFIPLNDDDAGQATRLLFFDLNDIADTEE